MAVAVGRVDHCRVLGDFVATVEQARDKQFATVCIPRISPTARRRLARPVDTPGVRLAETAKSEVSIEVIKTPPLETNFCKFISPLQPRPGRMSSVSSVLPRLGVSAVVFHGKGF